MCMYVHKCTLNQSCVVAPIKEGKDVVIQVYSDLYCTLKVQRTWCPEVIYRFKRHLLINIVQVSVLKLHVCSWKDSCHKCPLELCEDADHAAVNKWTAEPQNKDAALQQFTLMMWQRAWVSDACRAALSGCFTGEPQLYRAAVGWKYQYVVDAEVAQSLSWPSCHNSSYIFHRLYKIL